MRARHLYDLKADPEQKKDVSAKHLGVVARLHKHIERHLRRQCLDELIGEYQ